MESMIEIDELAMMYRVPVRGEGVRAAVRSLYHRTYREIPAVDGISLELEAGEIVGFLGPNGAGKTTTMKMLSGVLRPTGGTVSVAGFDPWERKPAYLKQIALIRGSQPLGGPPELTVMDVLRLQQLVYEIGEGVFRRSLALLSEMLGLGPLLDRQIRALSLGERMRCGLANALVYQPQVLFLDEPTIGMDVAVVEATRTFIEHYRDTTGATVLLTSHAMADVERLCPRVIVIDHGRVQFDGPLRELVERWAPYKVLTVSCMGDERVPWDRFGAVVQEHGSTATLHVARTAVPNVARALLADFEVVDLSIADPPLEQVLGMMFSERTTT